MYYPSLSKEQFFSRDVFYSGGINLWSQADQVPRWARDLVFNKDVEVHAVDFFTPLEKGKEWLFALTCQHQPCTGSLLMQGGDLFVRAAQDDTGYVSFHLGLEVMGRVVLVCRNFFGYNPSDTDFSINYRPPERFESLPLPLREAYYTRFDGLNIPGSITVGTYTRLLPFPVERPWQSWVRYLEEFAGYQKKYIPWLEERIPNVKPKRKGGVHELYDVLGYTSYLER